MLEANIGMLYELFTDMAEHDGSLPVLACAHGMQVLLPLCPCRTFCRSSLCPSGWSSLRIFRFRLGP